MEFLVETTCSREARLTLTVHGRRHGYCPIAVMLQVFAVIEAFAGRVKARTVMVVLSRRARRRRRSRARAALNGKQIAACVRTDSACAICSHTFGLQRSHDIQFCPCDVAVLALKQPDARAVKGSDTEAVAGVIRSVVPKLVRLWPYLSPAYTALRTAKRRHITTPPGGSLIILIVYEAADIVTNTGPSAEDVEFAFADE